MNSIKKRLVSVCLAVLMVVGLMPTSALAEEDGAAAGSAVQIGNYYKVDDENGGIVDEGAPSLTEGSTLQSYENGFVTINKTIEGTDTENEFIINLDVTTKSKLEQVELSEDAAAVLVIDTSNSMNDGRLNQAKRAAQAFINAFVEEGAVRKIAIVKFSGTSYVNGATTLKNSGQNWSDAEDLARTGGSICAPIQGLRREGGTNIEAGLVLAKNLLADESLKDISNKNIILLTDGQPTYGIDRTDKDANLNGTDAVCPLGKGMIGSGSSTSHAIHTQVEDYVKNTIVPAGISPYAVFVGDQSVECTQYHCIDTDGKSWLASAGFTAFAASDSDDLASIFEKISEIIEMQAKAWILEDPMGANIEFLGFTSAAAADSERVCVGDKITWNLRLAEATETTVEDETVYEYGLSYRIKLDNLAADFDETKYYATNGVTSLSYLLTTNNNGEETYKLDYAYANIPSVKGLEGSFSFNKVGSFGEALPGAAFTLTSVEDSSVKWTAVADENGEVSFAGIPSGHAYTLTETTVPDGYTGTEAKNVTVSYGVVSAGLGEDNTVINTSETTTITVEKKWVDGDNQDGLRPESITVQLLADKGPEHEAVVITPDEEGNWKYTWTDLEVYYGGEKIDYSVEEVDVPDGYESNEEDFVITNTHTPATTKKTVTKIWQDAGNQDGIRPESITVQLLANDEAYGEVVVIPAAAGDTWTYTWTGLPEFKEGEPITYTVEEKDVPAAYTAEAAGMTITNSYTPATRDITVTKAWVDGNNQDGNRPESILVQLYANGAKVGEPVSLNAANGWEYTYEGLAQKANGADIEYTVEELNVPEEYTVTINGFDITNSYDPKVTSVTVSKVWEDADNQDGIRPESITVFLYADEIETDKSVVLNDENEWTAAFEGLPVYQNGQEIDYYVVEAEVEGYESVVTGNASDGYIITNTHKTETVAIAGTKTWNDNNNQDGIRPESITVNLLANGEKVDSKTVTAKDGWAWSFTNLDKNEKGKEIVYTITEDAVDGYTSEVDGFDVINTHEVEKTKVSVKKVWEDAKNQDKVRPESITVTLYADKVATEKTLTLNEANGWTGTFEDLDVYADGEKILYDVQEVAIEGYTLSKEANAERTEFTLTNTHEVEKISVAGQKTWKDADNQDGKRPGKIVIRLYKNNKEIASQEVTAENGWKWEFTDLEKYTADQVGVVAKYTISEDAVDGYTSEVSDYNVTNTHNPEKVNVSVKKIWEDADDQDGLQSKSVVIKLKADNEETGKTITLTEAGNWTGTFENLDKYKAGDEIQYTIEEVAINGYETKITGDMNVGYTVTNTHTPETITLTGSKTWVDNNDQDGIRPESITIRLLADGNEVRNQEVAIAEDGSASWKFEDLPKYRDHGTEIVYAITEDAVSEYTPTVDGMNVTNTHTPYETSVTVSKVWADNNDQDGLQPEDVTINLLADGNIVATQILNEGNNWQHTFTELPVNANSKAIVYTVEEVEIDGYTATYTGDAKTGYTVTNTHTPETITLTGSKEWDDNNNQDGKRPESITIRLLADGEQQEVYVASEENDWAWEFDNLPKYRDHGTEIIYTITEDVVEDYTAKIDGMNVTNTHTPEKTTVTVSKVWKDANDQDGIRPEKITVFLHADEYETDKSVVLSEENNWTAIFNDLPVYAAGQEIEYYVTEAEVEGYESVVTGDATIGYTITNIHEPATVEVAGTKTWKDNNNQDGKRPESITVNLIANGEKIDSVEVTEADGWAYKFENLPKFEAGEEIAYAVTENAVEGYTVTVDGYNLTNSYTPELTSVTVTKNWQDTNDKDGIRPDSITVRLLANGKDTGLVMKLTAEYKWVGMFAELPAYENGKKIEYTVTEDAVKDYNTVITGSAEKGFEITNSHTSVPKTGDDNNITLYASAAGVSVVALLAMAVILKKKKSEEI